MQPGSYQDTRWARPVSYLARRQRSPGAQASVGHLLAISQRRQQQQIMDGAVAVAVAVDVAVDAMLLDSESEQQMHPAATCGLAKTAKSALGCRRRRRRTYIVRRSWRTPSANWTACPSGQAEGSGNISARAVAETTFMVSAVL